MSNFQPTVGRTVQYVDNNGDINAAIITQVNENGVSLRVFPERGIDYKVSDVALYRDDFESRKRAQPNTYLLHWQGR